MIKIDRVARVWHATQNKPRTPGNRTSKNTADQLGSKRAGDGNRTRKTSLEDSVRLPHKLLAKALKYKVFDGSLSAREAVWVEIWVENPGCVETVTTSGA
jgi:hypothetical protein